MVVTAWTCYRNGSSFVVHTKLRKSFPLWEKFLITYERTRRLIGDLARPICPKVPFCMEWSISYQYLIKDVFKKRIVSLGSHLKPTLNYVWWNERLDMSKRVQRLMFTIYKTWNRLELEPNKTATQLWKSALRRQW